MKDKQKEVLSSVFILIVLCCAFLFGGWFEKQYKKLWGYYYVYRGDKAFLERRFQDAIDEYKKGLEEYPEHAKARCNLANMYSVYEDYYSAAEEFEIALRDNPDNMVCRMDYAIILAEKLADYDKAVQQYGKITETHPFSLNVPFLYNNSDSIKKNRGIAYYNMGKAYKGKSVYMGENTIASLEYLRKSKKAYESAKEIIPQSYDMAYNLAMTYHLLGENRNAGYEYCRAIDLNPFAFEAHYNLGILLKTLGQNKYALSELEKAAMLSGDNIDNTQAKYLYEIIADVRQDLVSKGESKFLETRKEETQSSNSEVKIVNSKVRLVENSDEILTKKLKECPSLEFFGGL